jgi:hypothetical protein
MSFIIPLTRRVFLTNNSTAALMRRWKTNTVSQPLTTADECNETLSEWDQAKPFEQIPGARPLPIVGTTWVLFPIVGKKLMPFAYTIPIVGNSRSS